MHMKAVTSLVANILHICIYIIQQTEATLLCISMNAFLSVLTAASWGFSLIKVQQQDVHICIINHILWQHLSFPPWLHKLPVLL